jgi:uncharacterized membrane protein
MAEDTTKQATATKEDIEKNKMNAVLSYIGILILVPLLSDEAKKSPFAKFHLNQGLVLLIAEIALSVVWMVPVLGWLVGFVGGIALFVFWIMALIGAVNGEMKRVPILGDIELIK